MGTLALLLEYGGDLNVRTSQGTNALTFAMRRKCRKSIAFIKATIEGADTLTNKGQELFGRLKEDAVSMTCLIS